MRDWHAFWTRGETPWDRGSAAPPLLELMERGHGDFLKDARVLVPGCGSGHDVRALAAAGARPVGLDLSPKAVEVAQGASANGERYEVGDFLDGSRSGYDALWEHTCFCAIEPRLRDDYARAAAQAVKPGGRLLAVFYLDPDNDGEGPPFGATKAEVGSRFGRWFEEIEAYTPKRAYPGREGREWVFVGERNSEEVAHGPAEG
ncbi:methyltransferase domain-containing protein [Haloferula sargassicola]|uniref:Uncharacterized protein BCG_0605c n=1 Tax=Haloferula sargassicola TaxID=490096 RepID=A0ABP9UPU4_9BACT